jgi:hypothetical protein
LKFELGNLAVSTSSLSRSSPTSLVSWVSNFSHVQTFISVTSSLCLWVTKWGLYQLNHGAIYPLQ